MSKLKVYVHSFEVPPVNLIDKEGATQPWAHNAIPWSHAGAQAQKTAFQGLESRAGLFGKRYLSDEDREVLTRIENFCKKSNLEYEVVDVAKLGLRGKGIKTPAICLGEKKLCGIPSEEDMKKLLKG
jgi:hypothetical protein